MNSSARRKRLWILLILVLAACIWFATHAGNLLVIDAPQTSDVIVVLAGETNQRPAHALELLRQGYARRLLFDVPSHEKIYDITLIELVEKYIRTLPDASKLAICPIQGLSTRDESHDVARCLAQEQQGSRILIVTSDFHTRRALSIFQHEIKGKSFSIAAAHDSTQFGPHWWKHRQWAKTFTDEWLRVLWWNFVERWR
jgi:uncharacterized SAM-binding protein YcdF (DUF218 family)